MCRACQVRGDGLIWYKNPKNYGRRLYKRRKRDEAPTVEMDRDWGYEPDFHTRLKESLDAKVDGDTETHLKLLRETDEMIEGIGAFTQVVPLRDCYEIVDMMTPTTKLACICRKYTRGLEETEKTFSCLGLGQAQYKWSRWPERYRNGVVFMSPEEAKQFLTYWDKRGMVHIVMNYFGQIAGICNCDYPDCWPLRYAVDYDLPNALLKAEYVAKVDYDSCTGCGECIQRCQFGALKFEVSIRKANIDLMRCFGCGLCETGCSYSAINLVDRKSIPVLAEV